MLEYLLFVVLFTRAGGSLHIAMGEGHIGLTMIYKHLTQSISHSILFYENI